jgi:hypothetical protein
MGWGRKSRSEVEVGIRQDAVDGHGHGHGMDYGDCGVGVSKFNLKLAIDRWSYEMKYKHV